MDSVLDAVRWIDLPHSADERGVLTAIEGGHSIPFEIRRVFFMHGTPPRIERGAHAHRDTQQVLVALSGGFQIEVSDGRQSKPFWLVDPNCGLYIPPMVWVRLYDFSEHAVCLVLADTHYDRSRSIRTWEQFVSEIPRPGNLTL